MEDVSGEDLDWFWREWLFKTGVVDQAIVAVEPGGTGTTVKIQDAGGIAMPVTVAARTDGDEMVLFEAPVERWTTAGELELFLPLRDVRSITLDPQNALPDVDRSNNLWVAPGSAVNASH
jgi:hypothetical protein